jgi:tetratricopeptide (TPR) repeat protein
MERHDALARIAEQDAAGVEFLPHVFANARLARANRLFELGRGDASIAASADLVAKHGDEADPWFRLVVAAALSNQAQSLERLGRPAEAVTAWAELVRRFGASTDAALRVHVASALAAQGDDLEKLGAVAEAIALYRRLVDTFSASEHPDVARVHGWAQRRLATLAVRRRARLARRPMLVGALALALLAARRG